MSNDKLAKTHERFDGGFEKLTNGLLRTPYGPGIDDPCGIAYWLYHLKTLLYKQKVDGGFQYGSVGLTFELADIFAATTFNGEMR